MSRWSLAGRTVVITGGSGGLALALAPALRARGANIALLDLSEQACVEAAAALGPQSVARGWAADVRDLAGLERVMAEVAAHFGRIDVVMANAGIAGVPELLSDLDPQAWETMVDVNLNGVYRTFRAASPHVAATGGHLLATSSMAAFIHNPLHLAYAASKAGVWALCNTWRLELRGTGVTVGSLHPTFFKTPMMDFVLDDEAGTRLWRGNARGIWSMVDIDLVVAQTVRGIERRAARIVVPRRLWVAALAPGIAQAVVERIGFSGRAIQESVDLTRRRGRADTSGSTR